MKININYDFDDHDGYPDAIWCDWLPARDDSFFLRGDEELTVVRRWYALPAGPNNVEIPTVEIWIQVDHHYEY